MTTDGAELMDIEIISGGDSTLYYVKGHVDVEEFVAALDEFYPDDPELEPGEFPLEAIYYVWLRKIPCGQYCWCGDDFNYHVVDGTPGKQGAFPATITKSWRRNFARGKKMWMRDYQVYVRMPEVAV